MRKKPMQKVHFFFHDKRSRLHDKKGLKQFIQNLLAKEKKNLEILSFIFCSDEFLLEINRKFLKHNFYTDVITFDLSTNAAKIEGEVYISIDRVRENAKEIGITISNELHRVIFHGALHLCGYRDKNEKEIKKIRSLEDKYLKEYFNKKNNRFT
jgi:rRNA maturation RNase YbeY